MSNGSFSSFPYGNLSVSRYIERSSGTEGAGGRRQKTLRARSGARTTADMTEVEEVEEVDLERKLAGAFHKLSSAISKHQHKKVLKHANERK